AKKHEAKSNGFMVAKCGMPIRKFFCKNMDKKRGFNFYSCAKKKCKLLPGNGGVLTLGLHMYAQVLNPPEK
ncbi:MAG: hypothetical protein ACREA7_06415, partial [Nitrosotalea sp.]